MSNRVFKRVGLCAALAAAWCMLGGAWAARAADGAAAAKRLKDFDLPGLGEKVTLESIEPWEVVQLIEFLAHRGGLKNIVIGKGVTGLTTKLKLSDVSVGDALEVVLSMNRLAYEIKGGIMTIMTDAEYQAATGLSFYEQKQVRTLALQFADAERVMAMLQPVKSALGTVVADAKTGTMVLIDTPAKIQEMEGIVAKADLPTITRILPTITRKFALQYAAVADIESKLKPLVTQDVGLLNADARTKTIVASDLPHVVERMADLIAIFDARPKQVFIESKIVTVSLGDDYALGINWEHLFEGLEPRFRLGSLVQPPIGTSETSVQPGEGIGSLSYATVLGGGDLTVVVDALKTIGETRILSNPHVATLDGEKATIKVVTDRPYAEAKLESGTTNVVGENIKFIEVGVTLDVTPKINDEGLITMSIRPEISSVIGDYQAFRLIPIVRKAYAETTVMIKDGETILIAGMIENKTQDTDRGVPFLWRIPILGYLFKSTTKSTLNEETITFLTPRIITGTEPVQLLDDMKKTPKPMRTSVLDEKQERPARLGEP